MDHRTSGGDLDRTRVYDPGTQPNRHCPTTTVMSTTTITSTTPDHHVDSDHDDDDGRCSPILPMLVSRCSTTVGREVAPPCGMSSHWRVGAAAADGGCLKDISNTARYSSARGTGIIREVYFFRVFKLFFVA